MKKRFVKAVSLILALTLILMSLSACAGSSSESSASSDSDILYTIGVAVYDSSDPEMGIFYSYYHEYIEESFPVNFLLSGSLSSTEDVIAFVEEVKAQGGSGIIAFYAPDLEEIVKACEENEMYIVLGSNSISDEEYEAVKDNEYFLGVIGPDEEEEYSAGAEMAGFFIEEGAESFLILSGGSADEENYMHYTRTLGMLETLKSELGIEYPSTAQELASSDETVVVESGKYSIIICPGYLDYTGFELFADALENYDFDAVMAVCGVSDVLDELKDEIKTSQKLTLVGVIDCFSTENYEAFETTDANGNSLINYVKGKFSSMAAPAFAAMFNALNGDMDLVKPAGEAFRLYQTYWTAASEAEYAKLYGYTQSLFGNAYGALDLMEVIGLYNEDATYEDFAELAQSTDIDSVLERLNAQ